jgi:hypothetical protein
MSSLTIASIGAGCIFGGVLLGHWLQKFLPRHHLSKESQDTIKLVAGMIATMGALVLGLLVSSAKSSFDTMASGVAQNGAKIIMLDHVLSEYGPETKEAREQLRNNTTAAIERIWGRKNGPGGLRAAESLKGVESLQVKLRELAPKTSAQQAALSQAVQISNEIQQARLLLIESQQSSLPPVLLALLIFWLTMLFASFGLFAPRNVTVSLVLLIGALSVSSAIFLILEMSHPLDGLIRVSDAPLVKALEFLGK